MLNQVLTGFGGAGCLEWLRIFAATRFALEAGKESLPLRPESGIGSEWIEMDNSGITVIP